MDNLAEQNEESNVKLLFLKEAGMYNTTHSAPDNPCGAS
jgi:hypothetical protein